MTKDPFTHLVLQSPKFLPAIFTALLGFGQIFFLSDINFSNVYEAYKIFAIFGFWAIYFSSYCFIGLTFWFFNKPYLIKSVFSSLLVFVLIAGISFFKFNRDQAHWQLKQDKAFDLRNQQYQTRIEELSTSLKIHPTDAILLTQRGKLFEQNNRNNDAILDFQQAIQYKPDHIEAYLELAYSLQVVGKSDLAIEVCQKLLKDIEQNHWPITESQRKNCQNRIKNNK